MQFHIAFFPDSFGALDITANRPNLNPTKLIRRVMEIAFYKGKKRIFNRLTCFWLRGNFSHCELILGTDASGQAVCASSSMMDGGVRVKHMRLDPAHWDIVPVAGDPAQAWAWLREHEGEGYDYLGLVGFIFRVLGHSKLRWVCSEAVAAMLGIPESWRFDPCSLHAAVTSPQHI